MAKKTENTLDLTDVKDFTQSLSKMAKTATKQFSKQLKTDLKKSITSHLNEIAKDLEKNDVLANSLMKVGKSAAKQFSKVMATELKKSIVDTFNDTSKLLLKSEFLKNNLILLQKTTLKNFSVEFKKGLKKNIIDVFNDSMDTLSKNQSLKKGLASAQKSSANDTFKVTILKQVEDTGRELSSDDSISTGLDSIAHSATANFSKTFRKNIDKATTGIFDSVQDSLSNRKYSISLDSAQVEIPKTVSDKIQSELSNKIEVSPTVVAVNPTTDVSGISGKIYESINNAVKENVGKKDISITPNVSVLDAGTSYTTGMAEKIYESIHTMINGYVGKRTIPVTPNVLVMDAITTYIERVPEKVYDSIRTAIKSYVENRTIPVTPNIHVLDATGGNTLQMSDLAKEMVSHKEDEALATQKMAKALADVVRYTKEKIPFEKEELGIKVDEADAVNGIANDMRRIGATSKDNTKILNAYYSRWQNISKEIKVAFAPEVYAPLRSMLSFITDTFNAIIDTPFLGILTIFTKAISFLVGLVTKLEATVTDVSKAIGMSAGYSSKFAYNAVALEKSYRSMGITTQEAVDAAKGLVDTFTNLDYLTVKNQTNVTLLSKGLALSGDEVAKSLDTFMVMKATTFETAGSMLAMAGNMAKAAKIPMRAVMKDLSQNAEKAAKYGGQFASSTVIASIMAKKIGLSFSDIAKVADGVLDIENSVNSQFEASVLLGREINLERARYYSLIGDTKGVMNEVLKQVGSEAEFNKMNTIQREALAKAFGLDVASLARMISRKKEAQSIDEQMLDVQKKQTQTLGQFASKLEPMVGKIEQLMGALVELGYAFLDGLGLGVSKIGDLSSDVLPKIIQWLKDMKPVAHDIGVKIREWVDGASKFVKYLAIGVASAITLVGLVKAYQGAMAVKTGVQTMFGGNVGKVKDAADSMKDAAGSLANAKEIMAGAMKMFSQAAIILAFGAAIYMVAKSVELLGAMKWQDIAVGLGAISVIMVGLVVAVNALGSTGPAGMLGAAMLLSVGASVLMVSGAIWIAVDAFDRFIGTIKGAIEFLAKLDTSALDKIRNSVLSLTTTMVMAAGQISSAWKEMIVAGVSLAAFSVGVLAFSAALTAASVAIVAFSGAMYVGGKAIASFKEMLFGKSKEDLAVSVTESINKLLTLNSDDMDKIGVSLAKLGPQVSMFVDAFSASVSGDLEDKAEVLETIISPMSSFVSAYTNFISNLKQEIKSEILTKNIEALKSFATGIGEAFKELNKSPSLSVEMFWGMGKIKKEDISEGVVSGTGAIINSMSSLKDINVAEITEKLTNFVKYVKDHVTIGKTLEEAFWVSDNAKQNIKDFKLAFDFNSISVTNIDKITAAVKAMGTSTSGFKTMQADISGVANSINKLNAELMQTTNFSSKEITVRVDSSTKEYQSESLKYLKIIAVATTMMAEKKSAKELSKIDFDQLVNESVL